MPVPTRLPSTRLQLAALLAPALAITGAAAASAGVPPRTHLGQALEVPDAEYERAQIYHVLPGQDTQLTLTSAAPLQRTVLATSRAVGYVATTFDPEDAEAPILGGALRVPVASLASGSPTIDGMVRGAAYLDADAHPEMVFEITGAKLVETLESDDQDVYPYRVKVRGKLTARGVTQEVEMVAEARFHLTTFVTFTRGVGDLLTIAGRFDVDATGFGWEVPPGAGALVAPKLSVGVFLVASTSSPEKNLDPNVDLERWRAEQRYLTLARDLGAAEAAAQHGGEYLEKYGEDAAALAGLAGVILDEPGLANRDLALAWRLVKRAGEIDAGNAALTGLSSRLAALCGDPPAGG